MVAKIPPIRDSAQIGIGAEVIKNIGSDILLYGLAIDIEDDYSIAQRRLEWEYGLIDGFAIAHLASLP